MQIQPSFPANDSRKCRNQVRMENRAHIVFLNSAQERSNHAPLRSTATLASASSIGTVASAIRTIPSFSPSALWSLTEEQMAISSVTWCSSSTRSREFPGRTCRVWQSVTVVVEHLDDRYWYLLAGAVQDLMSKLMLVSCVVLLMLDFLFCHF